MIAICKLNQRQSLWLNLASHFQNPQSVWSHLGRNKEGKNSLLVRFRRRFFDMYILSVLCVLTGLSVMWNLWDSSILPPLSPSSFRLTSVETRTYWPLTSTSLLPYWRHEAKRFLALTARLRVAELVMVEDVIRISPLASATAVASLSRLYLLGEDRLPFHFCF